MALGGLSPGRCPGDEKKITHSAVPRQIAWSSIIFRVPSGNTSGPDADWYSNVIHRRAVGFGSGLHRLASSWRRALTCSFAAWGEVRESEG